MFINKHPKKGNTNDLKHISSRINSGPLFKHWERDYSVFFCTAWGKSYDLPNSQKFGEGTLTLSLVSYVNGVARYYRLIEDNEKFLGVIAKKIKKRQSLRGEIFTKYAFYGDQMLKLFNEIKRNNNSNENFIQKLVQTIVGLISYQILIIHRTDSYAKLFGTVPEIPEQIYHLRKKYEPAFGLFESHFEELCKSLTNEKNRAILKFLKLVTPDELATFIKSGKLPSDLETRKEGVVISHIPVTKIFYGEEGEKFLQLIEQNEKRYVDQEVGMEISGQTVYGNGVISGSCQVITDYDQMNSLETGKILVTPSTLPKYNHIYLRAKAIITDEGGALAHAAIFCREHQIPGIVGTKNATQIIKTGDLVEVDNDRGIVKILNKK